MSNALGNNGELLGRSPAFAELGHQGEERKNWRNPQFENQEGHEREKKIYDLLQEEQTVYELQRGIEGVKRRVNRLIGNEVDIEEAFKNLLMLEQTIKKGIQELVLQERCPNAREELEIAIIMYRRKARKQDKSTI